MNICKPHQAHECPECWPGGWNLGLEAAVYRLKVHLANKPNTRFDARDRKALTYLLTWLDKSPDAKWLFEVSLLRDRR